MSIDKFAAIGSSVVVAAAVVVGLVLAGSPTENRLQRLDKTRRYDLVNITSSIDTYSADKKTLPTALPDLVNGRRLSRLPSDPITDIPYTYNVIDETHYELCATFSTASVDDGGDDFWAHPKGHHCFTFEVRTYENASLL
ncbi:MAG: hypothetical protein AAGC71_01820 [Pseudomonadota bacterium]